MPRNNYREIGSQTAGPEYATVIGFSDDINSIQPIILALYCCSSLLASRNFCACLYEEDLA
jgi:hypothetical protein